MLVFVRPTSGRAKATAEAALMREMGRWVAVTVTLLNGPL